MTISQFADHCSVEDVAEVISCFERIAQQAERLSQLSGLQVVATIKAQDRSVNVAKFQLSRPIDLHWE